MIPIWYHEGKRGSRVCPITKPIAITIPQRWGVRRVGSIRKEKKTLWLLQEGAVQDAYIFSLADSDNLMCFLKGEGMYYLSLG